MLWPELRAVPRAFVLYGGTALALRLGHRASVDFDFFAHDSLDPHALERALPWLRDAQTLQEDPDARTVVVSRGGEPVKLSFFGNIGLGRVGTPDDTNDGVVRVASLLDLSGTKLKVLLQRVEKKDYLDIAALLEHGLPLETMLGAAAALFGPSFNSLVAQKTLAYFEGGDLASLPRETKQLLVSRAARDLHVTALPKLSGRLD
jgi:hypothetical protein